MRFEKDRGPKNEEEEEEIGDGQSTASLMPGCKMNHLLAIIVLAYEGRSEKITQVPTVHQQGWELSLGLCRQHSSPPHSLICHVTQNDSVTFVFPPSHPPDSCFWKFSKSFNPPLCFKSWLVLSWPTNSYKCTHCDDHYLLTFFSDSFLSNGGRILDQIVQKPTINQTKMKLLSKNHLSALLWSISQSWVSL